MGVLRARLDIVAAFIGRLVAELARTQSNLVRATGFIRGDLVAFVSVDVAATPVAIPRQPLATLLHCWSIILVVAFLYRVRIGVVVRPFTMLCFSPTHIEGKIFAQFGYGLTALADNILVGHGVEFPVLHGPRANVLLREALGMGLPIAILHFGFLSADVHTLALITAPGAK